MKEKFTPIAMKCNQEQFNSIKPKLEKARLEINRIDDFYTFEYLTNNFCGKLLISNLSNKDACFEKLHNVVCQTWNESVFLEACGIEIEEPYTITKEQILQLESNPLLVRELFPNAFKEELESGKWYKYTDSKIHLVYFTDLVNMYGYGFDCNGWQKHTKWLKNTLVLAAETEVSEAFINEAKKRGFVKGAKFISARYLHRKVSNNGLLFFNEDNNTLTLDGNYIFYNGIWAEIVKETVLTMQEIADKFGVDVSNLKIKK